MPLMLLLDDVFHHFKRAVKRLEHWNELVDLEVLLVARARSAFLVHWFGSLIPLDGSSVRIAIVNMDALRKRYTLVMSKRRSQLSEGPSVLEPAADIAGGLAGAIVSPLNFMPILVVAEPYISDKLDSKILKILVKFGVVFNWLTYGSLGPIAFVALAALGPMFILGSAWVPGTAEVQDFLTAATRVVKPLQEFWRQVSGPRDQVKNPIVRAGLDVLDKLAVMFPFFMETVTFLIGKIGPLLDPLLHQFQALGAYASSVAELGQLTVTGLVELLKQWLDPKHHGSLASQIRLVVEGLGSLFDLLTDGLALLLFGNAADFLSKMGQGLADYFVLVKEWAVKRFMQILEENPLTKAFRAIQARIDLLAPILARLQSTNKKKDDSGNDEPSRLGEAFKFQFKDVKEDITWMKANVPKAEFGVDIDSLLIEHGLKPFPLIYPVKLPPIDVFADVKTKFAARPRSIFSGERKALDTLAIEQFEVPNAAMAITAANVDETRLREALLAVASKVLPPAIQPFLESLSGAMEKAETSLGQKSVPDATRRFPVLDLPEERKLRPVVGKLVVRVRGAAREVSEEWTEGLRVALRGQVYPMPVDQGGAA